MNNSKTSLLVMVILFISFRPSDFAQASDGIGAQETPKESKGLWIQPEVALAWQSYNDVQIPSTTGTRFSLTTFGKGPVPSARIYLGYRISNQHEVRALAAPLRLQFTGRLTSLTQYMGQTFVTNQDTEARYQFDSYRMTYRYGLLMTEDFLLKVGFTGKLRVAEISLKQGGTFASRKNIGFVPLLHLSARQSLTENLALSGDLDGLWSPYGRAEDLALFAEYQYGDGVTLLAGYRTVEGGSSGGGGVYSFAWLHFATVGMRVEF